MKFKSVPELPLLENKRGLTNETVVELLKTMLTIRYSETLIAQRVSERAIFTPCHLYMGEEASAVGVCSVLKDTDFVFSNHRSHGHFLAKGGNLKEFFAEIYCRETGCSKGRGGSMHLCDPSKGLLGSSSIVAGVLGIGLGPAFRSKIFGEDHVSVIFHGDCVPEEGVWTESLNFAAINKLPVVYVCENNLYAASAPLEDRRIYDNIADVAADYGLHSDVVDGNDLFAVNAAAEDAVQRARAGEGPQFIETRTYRWLGHVGHRDDIDVGLRHADELAYWKSRCPIKNLEQKLLKENILTTEQIEAMHKEAQEKVKAAEDYALSCSKPDPSVLYENVYKN